MRESLDQWPFVIGAYALTIIATLALAVWSVMSMRRAERKRDEARRR
ncbi:heme exporter protein CcmD [Qipengyuania sp.]